MSRRLLRLPGVKAATGLSKADIYREQREGRFPHSIPLGRRSVAWIEDEVDQWIEEKIAAERQSSRSEKAAPNTNPPPRREKSTLNLEPSPPVRGTRTVPAATGRLKIEGRDGCDAAAGIRSRRDL
jgi:prophage regulatory protein